MAVEALEGECEATDDAAVSPPASGCSRTHSAVTLGDWSDPLDPDAETQMVYRQLLLGRDRLRWVPPHDHRFILPMCL